MVAISTFILSILSLNTAHDRRLRFSRSHSLHNTNIIHYLYKPTKIEKKSSNIIGEPTFHPEINSVKNSCHGNDKKFPKRNFLYPGKEFQCHKDQEILVIVRSDSQEMREKIRDTWGDYRLFGESRTKVVFAVLKLITG